MKANGKIGIFDSGIGGVTVLKEILKILPNEDYLYYSDSKNNPYGDKTQEEILKICEEIVEYFVQEDCKIIVIACNTASAKAAEELRKQYPTIPFIAIEPAYKMVYDYAYEEPSLIMATKGTVESEKFNLLYQKYNNHKTKILSCVGLADIIEEGKQKEIQEYLARQLEPYQGKIKNVVLGCTHYPLIQDKIKNILGDVTFFNGAERLAIHLEETLKKQDIKNTQIKGNIIFIDSKQDYKKEIRFFYQLEKEG